MAFSGFDAAVVDEVTGEQVDYSPFEAEPASLPIAPAASKAKAKPDGGAPPAHASTISDLLGPHQTRRVLGRSFRIGLGSELGVRRGDLCPA